MANKVAFHKLSLGGNNSKTQHAMTVKPSPCNSTKIGVSIAMCICRGDNSIGFGAMSLSI